MITSKYVKRAYETVVYYDRHYDHHGLAIALGTEDDIRQVTIDISQHDSNGGSRIIRPELNLLYKTYMHEPVLYTPKIFKVFNFMTNQQGHIDALLAINTKGYLIDLDGFFAPGKNFFEKVEKYDLEWGSRHWNCAAASCQPGVVTMALSENRKTITTFYQGRVVEDFCYDPRKQ